MSNRLTNEQKLYRRELKKPNFLLYWILMLVIVILNRKTRTHFNYKAHPSEEKGPIVMISNHASRVEYQFTAPVCLPKRLNYVVGYNEFYRFPLSIVLRLMQVVPKKNFTPDMYAVRQIFNLVRKGANICIMPEGMSSITGMAQPVIPGGAKLLKKLGVPVYYTKISGAYLTYTKHCLDERVGRIEVTVDRMFSAEDLKSMSVSEIEDTMNRLLAHDDYIWNKEKQIHFNGKGNMARNLDTLLYMCPRCGAFHKMNTEGNTMECSECKNTVVIDEAYNIRPADAESVCPALVTDWTIMEREKAAEYVKNPDFSYSDNVKIGVLPSFGLLKHKDTSVIAGEGVLKLDTNGLHFSGRLYDESYFFDLGPDVLYTYGMCTDITRFYTFVNGRFMEFYPEKTDVLRWFHLTEELHRFKGGVWKNTEYRHC